MRYLLIILFSIPVFVYGECDRFSIKHLEYYSASDEYYAEIKDNKYNWLYVYRFSGMYIENSLHDIHNDIHYFVVWHTPERIEADEGLGY